MAARPWQNRSSGSLKQNSRKRLRTTHWHDREVIFSMTEVNLPMRTIKYVNINSLKTAKFNPESRVEEHRLRYLRRSMEEHGFLETCPIIIDEQGVIADGHRRYTVAKLLGMEKVPTLLLDGELTPEQYWSLNTVSESPTATEVLEAYTLGMNVVPLKQSRAIMLLESTLGGKQQVGALFNKTRFSPQAYYNGKRIANYCNRGDDKAFIAKSIVWLIERKMQTTVGFAIKNSVDPAVLMQAVEEDRPLNLIANVCPF
jgi:ParB-like nuclease domain